MKILHTADVHLRKYNDERWEALQTVLDLGNKEKVDIVVISGDLFDSVLDAESLRPKIRDLFTGNNFKIVLLPGNHDIEAYKTGLYFGKDVTIITDFQQPFSYEELCIWGLPYEPIEGEEILHKLRAISKHCTHDRHHILLYHGELMDNLYSRRDFGSEGDQRYMPVKLSYFKECNIEYVLAGHFHSKFDVRQIEENRYFVYPGSPVSITKKETGQRKVNMFLLGEPPQEFPVDTFHYESIQIELDPFQSIDPIAVIEHHMQSLHPKAKIILTVTGYINSKDIGMSEVELTESIRKSVRERIEDVHEDVHCEFRDIHTILADSLFQSFEKKLEEEDCDDQRKKEIRELVIKAMMRV